MFLVMLWLSKQDQKTIVKNGTVSCIVFRLVANGQKLYFLDREEGVSDEMTIKFKKYGLLCLFKKTLWSLEDIVYLRDYLQYLPPWYSGGNGCKWRMQIIKDIAARKNDWNRIVRIFEDIVILGYWFEQKRIVIIKLYNHIWNKIKLTPVIMEKVRHGSTQLPIITEV